MKRPHRGNSIWSVLITVLVTLALGAGLAQAQSHPTLAPRTLLAASNETTVWLVRPLPGDKSDPVRCLVLRHEYQSIERYWTQVAVLNQLPAGCAPWGDRLAIVDASGAWALVDGDGQTPGPAVDGLQFIDVLNAKHHLAFLARNKAGEFETVLFDGRNFTSSRNFDDPDQSPHFIHIGSDRAFLPTDTNRERSHLDDCVQTSDGRLYATRSGSEIRVFDLGWRSAILDAAAAASAHRLTLTQEPDELARLWWMDGDDVVSQRFVPDGQAIESPTPLPLRPPPSPPLFERALMVLGTLALLLVLLAGGRQTVAVSRSLATKNPPRPAPLARRFVAGLVDCLPLIAVAAYLIAGGKLTVYGGMLRFDGMRSEAILAAGVMLYLALVTTFELRWRSSIGKWLFALRIANLDGQPPRVRAILIRNVLRLVDLNLITLLMVPATPLRQRLGDFLAGTMVIDAADAVPSATPSEGEP